MKLAILVPHLRVACMMLILRAINFSWKLIEYKYGLEFGRTLIRGNLFHNTYCAATAPFSHCTGNTSNGYVIMNTFAHVSSGTEARRSGKSQLSQVHTDPILSTHWQLRSALGKRGQAKCCLFLIPSKKEELKIPSILFCITYGGSEIKPYRPTVSAECNIRFLVHIISIYWYVLQKI